MFDPQEFELINSEITAADAQSDELADDLAGMTFQSTIAEKVDEVPEKIKLWRENFSKNLEEKDERVSCVNSGKLCKIFIFINCRNKEKRKNFESPRRKRWTNGFRNTTTLSSERRT